MPGGVELVERAGVAFTNAFNIANGVSAIMAISAAIAVAIGFSPAKEQAAEQAAAEQTTPN